MLGTKYSSNTSSTAYTWDLSVKTFGNWMKTLSKTTHNISTLNTGETSSNYFVKLSLSPHKSSHGTFLDSLIVDLFKIPDVNQRLKRAVYKSGTGTRGRGHRDACVGTWDLGTRDEGLGDVKYGTRGRGDAGTRGRGDAGTSKTRTQGTWDVNDYCKSRR